MNLIQKYFLKKRMFSAVIPGIFWGQNGTLDVVEGILMGVGQSKGKDIHF